MLRRARKAIVGAVLWSLVAFAVAFVALRVVVASVPAYADDIRAWVESQTKLTFEFDSLDARLRWYGPELVLRNARLLEPGGSQSLVATREARVAVDVWSLFRSGALVAGRLQLVEPSLSIVRLPDGRIRLLGQAERPAERPPFDLDRLPAGRVRIVAATVEYRDLMTGRGPWRLTDVDVDLERAHGAVEATGSAALPQRLGERIDFEGEVAGVLMEPSTLVGNLDAEIEDVDWSGWSDLLPADIARIDHGSGEMDATVDFANGALQQIKLDVVANGLALTLPTRDLPAVQTVVVTRAVPAPGASALARPVVERTFVDRPAARYAHHAGYDRFAARLRLRRDGQAWVFRAAELDVVPTSGRKSRHVALADLSGRFAGNLRSTYALELEARDLRLQELWPLALAFAPRSADRWLGVSPRGEVRRLALDATRERAGAVPRFSVDAQIEDLTTEPTGRWPGVRGLTATVSGSDEHGTVELRAKQAALQWPRLFRERLGVDRLQGDLDWRREGRTWILSGEEVRLEGPEFRARGGLELRYVSPAVSPDLRFDADVTVADVRVVPKYLPAGRLRPPSLSWLDEAFAGGSAQGHVSFRGPVRRFPFRYGEGEFIATGQVRDMELRYYPGFTPLTHGNGSVTFHNAGLQGTLSSGRLGDLAVRHATVEIEDFGSAVVNVDGRASGDVAAALEYLQQSPLAPGLGGVFAQLTGSGAADHDVHLSLPTRRPAERDYVVRTHFDGAALRLPALRAPVEALDGTLEIHDAAVMASDLRGRFLGGEFVASVAPAARAAPAARGFEVRAKGRLDGTRLPSFIGLPQGIDMQGMTGWALALRSGRPSPSETWTTSLTVSSDLVGLGITAPQPFAKPAAEERTSRVRIELGAEGRNDVDVDTGPARAQLKFQQQDGRWQLDRGIARFDGGAMPATLQPGLQVLGTWPEFDLGEWLALRAPASTRGRLSDWLGEVDVRLDDVRVFGFELSDVRARLADDGTDWLVDVESPMAEGRITVPLDDDPARPIVLDMRRLQLHSAPAGAPGRSASRTADPRRVPALQASIDDLTWEGRRLGHTTVRAERVPGGLRFSTLLSESPHHSFRGSGTWLADALSSRTKLEIEFDSDDLAAASQALGYRPSIESEKTQARASLDWPGPPSGDALRRMSGQLHVQLGRGKLRHVEPGAAGRVLGLMSVVELPRRLALDFRDVTEEGLAFDSVQGDFEIRDGNAYTENLLLEGAAVDIGIAGRTGLASQDYDQTVVVSGNPSGPLTVAGALAAGPVVGAGVLVLSQLFKDQLKGLTRAYYRVTGPWSDPLVQRVTAATGESAAAAQTAARMEPTR